VVHSTATTVNNAVHKVGNAATDVAAAPVKVVQRNLMLDGMLWARPELRQGWGKHQPHQHPGWGDLFFDLIFVGCAFRMGKFLKYSITDNAEENAQTILAFVIMFFNMFFSWTHAMSWEARFDTNKDLVHKILKAVEMFGIILMSAHVPLPGCKIVSNDPCRRLGDASPSSAGADCEGRRLGGASAYGTTPWQCLSHMESNFAIGFSFACMVPRAIQILQLFELTRVRVEFPKDEKPTELHCAGVVKYARVHIARHALSIGCFAIACFPSLVITNANEKNTLSWVVLTCWTSAVVLEYVAIWAMYAISYVPANFSFLIHRYGEFVMLMLGEGVLSIVTTIDDDKIGEPYHYSSMFTGFVLLLTIQYVYYSSQPMASDRHIVKNSKTGSVIWLSLHVSLSASLVALGVSIAQLIDNTTELKTGNGIEKVELFRGAATVCFISVTGLQVVHRGIFEEVLLIRAWEKYLTCCSRKQSTSEVRKKSSMMELVKTSVEDACSIRMRKIMLWLAKLLVIIFINVPRVDCNVQVNSQRHLGASNSSDMPASTSAPTPQYHNFELMKVAMLSVVFAIAHVSEQRFESRYRKRGIHVQGTVSLRHD
jgi:low temperature requirement protein LtrA